MSVRSFLIIIFSGLGILTAIAYAIIPAPSSDGRIPIVWTTDANPARELQVEWFNKLYPDNVLSIDPDNTGVMKVVVQSSAGMGPEIGRAHV